MVQSGNSEVAKLQLRIKFRSEDLEGFVERYGADVSPGGIFIRSRQPLPVGTRVVFSFALMNAVPVLVGEGTIAWVRQPEGEQGGGNPGMGIRFDSLNDESRMKLARILEAKTAREKSGKPPLRGPTPIPDGPPLPAFPPSDATAKVRLTADGRIVSDMPAPPRPVVPQASGPGYTAPAPSAVGPAPSLPYASSFSNPQTSLPVPPVRPGFGANDVDRTRMSPPPAEMLRRSTPALGTESSPQPFAPSKTLGNAAAPLLGPGGQVVRSQPNASVRASVPGFTAEATRGAGGGAFSSTLAFGQEPTKLRRGDDAIRAEPTRGSTPAPDLLRRATPPPMPVTPPPSVFSRPTPIPGAPLSETRATGRSGPVVNRPTGSRPVVTEAPKPAIDPGSAAAWSSEQTEIVEDLPRFDEEERTTTVRGQTLAASEGFGQMPLTRPDLPKHLTPKPPAPLSGPPPRIATEALPQSFPSMPVLSDLFEGEALPGPGDSASLLAAVGSESEFGRSESTGRGRRATPVPGASMVARKAETTEFRVEKRRPMLWMVFAGVAIAAGVFAVVNYQESRRPVAPATPVAAAPNGSQAPVAPTPPEAAKPQAAEAPSAVPAEAATDPAAPAAEPLAEKPTAAAVAPEPAPEEAVAAKAPPAAVAPKPAPAAVSPKPVPRPAFRPPVRPARPAAPVAAPAAEAAPAAPIAAPTTSPGGAAIIDDDDTAAVYWLRVRSTPSGADVFIDGELEGQTPFQRRIFDSTRPYAVSVRKEGFESNDRMISASDPWTKVKSEFLLTVSVKLRKAAPAAVPPSGEAAP